MVRVKYWEMIADNLSKAGWSLGCVSAIDSNARTIWIADAHRGDGKRFVAGREKKSQRTCLRERPPRVGQEKSAPLSVPFAQLNRKTLRWEEVSQALVRHEKKSQIGTRPGLFGRNSPIESTGYSIYFPVGAGAGATTSLCCAQAPSSKAVTRTATIMIIFRNFNLSRLLSSQVARFGLGGEPRRSNAFLYFFEPSQIGRPGLFRVAGSACACGHYFLLLLRTSSQSPRQLDC